MRGVRELDKKGRVRAGRLVAVNLGSRRRRAEEVFSVVAELLSMFETNRQEVVLKGTLPALWSRVVQDLAKAERERSSAR